MSKAAADAFPLLVLQPLYPQFRAYQGQPEEKGFPKGRLLLAHQEAGGVPEQGRDLLARHLTPKARGRGRGAPRPLEAVRQLHFRFQKAQSWQMLVDALLPYLASGIWQNISRASMHKLGGALLLRSNFQRDGAQR